MEKKFQSMSIRNPETPKTRPPQASFPAPVMPPAVAKPIISAGQLPASARDLFNVGATNGQPAPP